ncbi:MAG: asparagine synthase (glutamine-hydrolyzing) [Rhodospirillales bacterium]|nr:asparagine synthase (glutamine-hydrolyzing) [Rhodospirillales bacterium]
MCGLAGLVDRNGLDRDAAVPGLERAVRRLHPRGPDDNGMWFDGHAALGHTRLAIVDLSAAGRQPMVRGSLALAYNGEIYNHAELRAELEEAGTVFEGHSDTEVLIRAWERWGEGVLNRLNGMFAFALWDTARKALFLARDRFGKKPLLFARTGTRLAFASDLVALEAVEGTRRDVDPAALRLLFALRWLPEPWSIAAGVRHLAPGHVARFDRDGMAMRSFVEPETLETYTDEETAAADLVGRFDAAVARRMVADVPVGAYLSGGIDSALVVAAMVRNASTVRTCTVGFADVPAYYEERPQARAVADHLGTEHTEIELGADDALAAVGPLFDGLDEPFADSSALPSFVLARETRRHVTVALSGDGGDEVFGGYRLYRAELYAEAYRRLPGWLRSSAIEPAARHLPDAKGGRLAELSRRARRFLDHAGKQAIARRAGLARLLEEDELDRLLVHPSGHTPTVEVLFAAARPKTGADPLTAMLMGDQRTILPGDMLAKVDRTSMANSLEVRSPFLDASVVDCANAMPGAFKIRRGAGKAILRRAFAGRVPAAVFRRPKKGFELPIDRWLAGPLSDLVKASCDAERLRRQGLIDPDLPGRWRDDLLAGRRDTSWQLWTLIAFQAWADRRARALP